MRLTLFVFIFLIFNAVAWAQSNSKNDSSAQMHRRTLPPQQIKPPIILTDSIVENDKLLNTFKKALPKDWALILKGNRMVIRAKDSVWVAFYNAAGRSAMDTSERNYNDTNYIKQNGKRILPEASFRFEYLWSQEKMEATVKFNNNLYNQIKNLKVKYNLQHLQEWHKWGESGFYNATPEEEGRIAEFEKEKKNLESQRITFPMWISDNYSIFMEYKNWLNDKVYMVSKVYPKESIYQIDYTLEFFLQVPEERQ